MDKRENNKYVCTKKKGFVISTETYRRLKHMVDDGIHPNMIARYTKIPIDVVLKYEKSGLLDIH